MENQSTGHVNISTEPDQVITSVNPQTPKSNQWKVMVIVMALLLLGAVGVIAYLFQKQNTAPISEQTQLQPTTIPQTISATTEPLPTTAVAATVTPSSSDMYSNSEYKFSFKLSSGEHAVVCPNKSETNDNVAVWISTGQALGSIECATDGSRNAVFASRKAPFGSTVQAYVDQLDTDYVIQTTPITISGITGVKVTGTVDPNQPASPLPSTVSQAVLVNNGVLYIVDNTFLSKDFQILK